MDDRILELTEKIYNEGVIKAKEEASVILDEAKFKAEDILAEAEKKVEQIISAARQDATELKQNVHEEIKHASHQAINTVKQKIAELITLKITDQPLKDLLNDRTYISDIISQLIDHWKKSNISEGFDLVLPASIIKDSDGMVIKAIHEQFGQNINIEFSHKIQSGFRISPAGNNYIISFTEQDFTNFFSQFLRPKTIKILYNDDTSL
jgi:V/A-type H+-transporting ATPase subunit E